MMSKTLKKQDGDVVILESNGRPYWIDGVHKLTQDCADALMTEYDPSRGYGSQVATLDQVNSPRAGSIGLVNRGFIKTAVREALERLQQLQNTRLDQLTADEAIGSIGIIRVIQFSRTGYLFSVNVRPAADSEELTTSFVIRLSHQLPQGAKPNLPGSVRTDDVSAI